MNGNYYLNNKALEGKDAENYDKVFAEVNNDVKNDESVLYPIEEEV